MKIKVLVHEAEEGGYSAEVPAIPGCATQGESMEELMANVHEAIEACLDVDADRRRAHGQGRSTGMSLPRPAWRWSIHAGAAALTVQIRPPIWLLRLPFKNDIK